MISPTGEVATAIRNIIQEEKPKKIVEVGPFNGDGSTFIIASSIKEFVPDAIFKSIECDIKRLIGSARFIESVGLSDYVEFVYGFSVKKSDLPTREKIDFWIENRDKSLFVDDETGNGYLIDQYYPDAPEYRFLSVMCEFHFKPDFVLLDSAGHLGAIEFSRLMELVNGNFILALDDAKTHVKHRPTADIIKKDSRFSKIFESNERFGFEMYRFTK